MDSSEPEKPPTKSTSSVLRVGPGFLITAAFIGPGTVVSASSAGYKFSLHLGWVVLLSTLAAILLQAMAGRLGVVTRLPLGQIVNDAMPNLAARIAMSLLIFLAILFGNTAYQSGNLMGGVQGADLLAGGVMLESTWFSLSALTIGAIIAGTLLWTGNPKIVSRFLVGLVVLMSLTFVGMAALILFRQPFDVSAWMPLVPAGSEATTLALFGTTIVPYNLFLYTSLAAQRWGNEDPREGIRSSLIDVVLAVGLGGLVTGAILVVGNFARQPETEFAFDSLPALLEAFVSPQVSSSILGLGLFGAGLSSAITAPLAAAYAAAGIFRWEPELRTTKLRVVWLTVLGLGWLVAALGLIWGVKLADAIIVAQAANGLVLPVMAILLWWLVTRPKTLGPYALSPRWKWISLVVVVAISAVWIVNVTLKLWPSS